MIWFLYRVTTRNPTNSGGEGGGVRMRSADVQNPVVCSCPCLYTFPTTLAFLCTAAVAFGSSSLMSNAGLMRPLRSSLPTRPVVTAVPYCAPMGPVKRRKSLKHWSARIVYGNFAGFFFFFETYRICSFSRMKNVIISS